ncbi:MAG: serine/threonine-protein phosphatase [Nitrospira sp. SB0672_bin_25]|nr:serine/threonine-protein phosphatase [Nitrospira sp. SB0666_bin_27]MYF23849.1 serine/threonine-protein phosphatase [Nitrospira sp. SB0678_bin_10]MYJ53896.1 serine/threonine-protein phosphatase [Nitrospira sp. SB0672_bin_25]
MDRTVHWHGAGATHTGLVRPTNQDAFLVANDLGLWIIADGMGGHAGGDVASKISVETIHNYITEHAGHHSTTKTDEIPSLLRSAVGYANEAVLAHAKANPEFTGMGTTVVLFFLPAHSSPLAWVAHAGDSRAYLIRDQQISALTRDHTVLEEYIQQGLLAKSTPATHPLGHSLTRGVGANSTIETDILTVKIQPEDEVILFSDGLIKMLNDEQILETLVTMRAETPEHKCQAFIDQANDRGGVDNTTVILIARSR